MCEVNQFYKNNKRVVTMIYHMPVNKQNNYKAVLLERHYVYVNNKVEFTFMFYYNILHCN